MAAVLTEIVTFIYLLARMCCVQGQTPTGMLHDYTCIPFVQCSATFTTEFAQTISMKEIVNNVLLVKFAITTATSTCSVSNNFSVCANHTSESSKFFTVKTFFPSELPRNANQFECIVTGLYTNSQTYTNKYVVNVTFEKTTTSSTTQAAITILETATNLLILQSSSDVVSKNVFVSTVSVLGVLLAILIVIIIGLFVRTSRVNGIISKSTCFHYRMSPSGHSAKATENESYRNYANIEPLANTAAISSAVLDDIPSPSESSSTATYDKLGSNLYESLQK